MRTAERTINLIAFVVGLAFLVGLDVAFGAVLSIFVRVLTSEIDVQPIYEIASWLGAIACVGAIVVCSTNAFAITMSYREELVDE